MKQNHQQLTQQMEGANPKFSKSVSTQRKNGTLIHDAWLAKTAIWREYLTVAAQIQGPPNKPQKMLMIDRMTMSKWRPFPFSSYTNRRLILTENKKVRNTMQLLWFRKKIRLIEDTVKCRHLKTLTNKRDFAAVSHQWCALFYRLLHSSTRHIEKVEGGERDTQLVHVNEATVV